MTDLPTMYEWFKGHDVFTWLEPLWNSGRWFLNREGKFEAMRTQAAIDTPWVHHGHQERADCLLGQILFNVVSKRMGQFFVDGEPFVPSGCQNCYKVVVRPKTLTQLFALDELEENLGHPSKCGIEVRESVGALYGGYFYNQGLEAGRECHAKIREALDDSPYLANIPVILKRGCTEMEHGTGPSDKWVITEEQKIIEDLVIKHVVIDPDLKAQPEGIIWRTKRRWIEWAFAHGDETYKKFTGGQPITPGYVTYQGD